MEWREEMPEDAKKGSFGGLRGQFWVCKAAKPSGNRNNLMLMENFFFFAKKKPGFFWPKKPLRVSGIGELN